MTSAPEAHKTAGVVIADLLALGREIENTHGEEARKLLDAAAAALSTPSVPAVAELSGDGLPQPIASGAEGGWWPKVKALEWRLSGSRTWFAKTSVGSCEVAEFEPFDGDDGTPIRYRDFDDSLISQWFATVEEAKAAAQADYERRILAALTASPAGDDPKALDAAARSSGLAPVDVYRILKARWDSGHLQEGQLSAVSREIAQVARSSSTEAVEQEVERVTRERDEARADLDLAMFAMHYADFVATRLSYPNDGVRRCAGFDMDALEAAKRLRDRGLVTIEDSPSGPMVAWAPGRGVARPSRPGKEEGRG